ncbi:MAG: aromatic amino acid transport family protein [Candidatus Uhrbacteria bacterium]
MLIGTMVGVGIFGVPFVIAQSGVVIGLLHFAVLTSAVLLVHLFFGEITLRTKDHHRLVGYAGRYFGPAGKVIASLSGVLGLYGALLAYITVSGVFLHALLGPYLGGTPWAYSIGFTVIASLAVIRGLRLVEELEFILTAFLFIVIALIGIVGVQRIDPMNFRTVHLTSAFLPYGVILFSLGGVSAIAEIRDLLRGQERRLGAAIAWGTILASLLTVVFGLIVVGVSGASTSTEAISGLAPTLGLSIVLLGSLLGFLTIATSFLVLGVYVNKVFEYDFHLPKWLAFALGIGVPFTVFLIGHPGFISVVMLTGALFCGLDGILVSLIVLRARKCGDRKPELRVRVPALVNWIVVCIFLAGMVITIRGLLIS